MCFQVILLLLILLSISFAQQSSTSSNMESSRRNMSIESYSCDENGYDEFLKKWSVNEKASTRLSSDDEYKERLRYFIDNCKMIHEWNSKNKYKLEFTYYADWSAEEFEKLGSTTQRYSGMKPEMPATQPFFNNTSYLDYSMYSVDPCDDVLKEGENTLRKTINKPQSCSVSWAFAITNSIEYAVKKMYQEEYEQDINIALSAQELIDCVGRDHGIENGCEGIPVAWSFDYVFENGIAYRQYYPHTNVYGECKVIPNEHKYHIAGYKKPEVYNKLGLFELLKKGPVAVTLGLDPEYFQFYGSSRENGPYFNTGYYRPSVYGVLLESKQYKEDGKEEVIEWPYFSVETRLRACDSLVLRLPILESVENANIGGIAGFAIRPFVSETVPTSFTCNENNYLTIESIPAYATELIFNNNSYPGVLTLDFSRFTQLKTLIVKNGAFANCHYFYISNSQLKVIEIGDNCFTGVPPTGEVRRLAGFPAAFVFANAPSLSTFKVGSGSLTNISTIDIGNVGGPVDVTVGAGSFANVESITVNDSIPSQEFGDTLAEAIRAANPGKTVDVVVPTEAPTTLPPTTLPPTTLPPTTLPPTTLPPTTLPPTTLPPTTLPPTTLPPTTLPPTTLPPTTLPPTTLLPDECISATALTITNDSDCEKLLDNGWKSINVNEGLCNSMTTNLTISDNPCLESIIIKKNTLKKLNSLVITNNLQLSSILIEDGENWDSSLGTYYAPFEFVKSVEISDLPSLSNFTTGKESFYLSKSLTLSSIF